MWRLYVWCFSCFLIVNVHGIPGNLLYKLDVPEANYLPKENDVSSREIKLREPLIFFGTTYESIYVNSNGFLSFQTEIPAFINIEFPLDYPIISPLYTNVDTRRAGNVSYYETDNPQLLQRATENIHEAFLNFADFQATSLFVATWNGVGYYNQGEDKVNTFQVAVATDGVETYVEFLYPENGIQWIQGTGDESGLPDARAQAGIISPEGNIFSLPGSGTEQVVNLQSWSNIGLEGQFLFKVDEQEIIEPDVQFEEKLPSNPTQCSADLPTSCHVHAKCIDYEDGFCCKCNQNYYGNGKHCIKKDIPFRVNGRIHGKINEELLEGLDLQSYVVTADGRAYTAVQKIPDSISFDIQSLQILGGVIGYLFAKPIRNAQNGYQLTGGIFNHTATINFLNTSQTIRIRQKYLGLDVFDQLRAEIDIQGDIPNLPENAKVIIDEYQEQYTLTKPGLVQTASQRTFSYIDVSGKEFIHQFSVEQSFVFDYCKFKNQTTGETWKLKVGKNFVSYESKEQIIRFGLSNKVTPLGDFDPCEEGRSKCMQNSACVVENDSYRCVCNPGYQQFYNGNETICDDVNECQTGPFECDYNAFCVNIVGGFTCQCYPGFDGNGYFCEPAKSCHNVTCNENAECVSDQGVAGCKCLAGFRGDGQTCSPIPDQSCYVANNCSPFGICSVSPETNVYSCSCLPGYAGDGYKCQLIPVETTTVADIETTVNSVVSTWQSVRKVLQQCLLGVCWCPEGYKVQQNSKYCAEDIAVTEAPVLNDNTCDVLNNCHSNATCLYSDVSHSYQCVCNEGFEGDGYLCEATFVSCTKLDNCHPQATCTYIDHIGKSKCICNSGFEGDGYSCEVKAICTSNQDCAPTEECIIAASQRYECVCKEGHFRDSQHICVSQSSHCGGGQCVKNAECLFDDNLQTFYCRCKSGYIGDGITICKERVVGCDTLNNCGAHATCEYVDEHLTYKCLCEEGYYGDGFQCFAERNCHIDPRMCDAHAVCLTDVSRKYLCQCNPGYVGNGTVCREISRHEGNFLLVNQGMATLRIPLEPSKKNQKRPIQIKSYQTAVGLDIDCTEGRVYWGDITGRAIRSSAFNGSKKEDFLTEEIGSPEGLAVDWVSRNIYWTDSTRDTIEIANLDSKLRKTLFNTGLTNPRGIAVHPQRGKIFWTDWDRVHPKIEWANADGTGREIFLQGESVALPNSLTIDYESDQLCWADAGTKKIECIGFDTKQRITIAVNCTYPFGLTTTDKHIYWSDWITKKIEGADKYTLARLPPLQVPLGGSGNKLYGLVAVANNCPSLTNVCQFYRNQCPADRICVPNGYGSRQCLAV